MTLWRFRRGLKVGDRAPAFDVPDETGERHHLSDYRGRWLVVFFYPLDNSPVCLREACAFNDQWDLFRGQGAEILGCSGQGAASHQDMSDACRLRYRLLCDVDGTMRKAWGVPMGFSFGGSRISFVVDSEGIVRFVFKNLIRGRDHAALTLKFLTSTLKTAD